MPFVPPLAQVMTTRTGIGGVVGHKRDYFSWRFAVDFAGGRLASLADKAKVEPVIGASHGQIGSLRRGLNVRSKATAPCSMSGPRTIAWSPSTYG